MRRDFVLCLVRFVFLSNVVLMFSNFTLLFCALLYFFKRQQHPVFFLKKKCETLSCRQVVIKTPLIVSWGNLVSLPPWPHINSATWSSVHSPIYLHLRYLHEVITLKLVRLPTRINLIRNHLRTRQNLIVRSRVKTKMRRQAEIFCLRRCLGKRYCCHRREI